MKMIKIIFGFAVVALSLAANATTYYVSPTGDDSKDGTSEETAFQSIATARGKMKANDTLILAAGTYLLTEKQSSFPAGTTICGATGDPRDVVLDGQKTYSGIFLSEGSGSVVSSLTVSNCVDTSGQSPAGINMGGLYAPTESGTVNLVSNCVVTCCRANLNATRNSTFTVDAMSRVVDCVISCNSNTAARATGAVLMNNGGELINCIVEDNWGIGVFGAVDGDSKVEANRLNATSMVVRACTVRNNTSVGMGLSTLGCGIYNVPTVLDCWIEGNQSANCGAGLRYQTDVNKSLPADFRVTVSNTTFLGNAAHGTDGKIGGGALSWGSQWCTVSNLVVDVCTFVSNTVDKPMCGGAIQIFPNKVDGEVVIRNSLFEGNAILAEPGFTKEGLNGSAALLCKGNKDATSEAMIRLENCTFVGNRNESASDNAVCVSLFNAYSSYGVVTNCVFVNNLSSNGTAVAGMFVQSEWMDHCFLYPGTKDKYSDTVINGTKAPNFQEGTWIPGKRSPMRDAGVLLPWMVGAKDLQRDASGKAFRDRVLGSAPDMGCFEYQPLGLLLILR